MSDFKQVYEICVQKVDKHIDFIKGDDLYQYNKSKTGCYDQEPRGCDFLNMWNWTTSLGTGMAPMVYRTEKKEKYLIWANTCQESYHDKIFNHSLDNQHDIGFLYSPYSVAMYQLTGDRQHRNDALKAADELVKRFDINGRYIDAWGKMDDDNRIGRTIVDCMINIQLLFWSWKETGHTIYRDIAKAHADTTIKYFIREDYSVAHSFEFDRNTGEILAERYGCGYGNGSAWARGAAWMIYGLAMTARYLQDSSYYELAVTVLDKYLEYLNDSFIPVWDFKLPPETPAAEFLHINNPEWDVTDPENCKFNVDTAAAAVVACAMIEMDRFSGQKTYKDMIHGTLEELCEKYFNKDPEVMGMLSHQNGEMVYAIYGDFYFLQALQQYLYDTESCW